MGSSSTLVPRDSPKRQLSPDELSPQDIRILELLTLKQQKFQQAQEIAHKRHLEWQQEIKEIQESHRVRETRWRHHIESKRKAENSVNEQRLLEARNKFIQSQNLLRKLIQEKEDRRKELMENQNQKGQEIRAAEEARRQAVEEALEQLLARDTQYRKELRSHLDTRMEIAKKRRSFHRQQYKEYISALNSQHEEKVQQRLNQIHQDGLDKKRSLREAIMEKYRKATELTDFKDRHLKRLKLARAVQCEKVLKLKEELEAKLDSWRKQLLQVQSMSIRKAEERFKMALQKKKTKVATDTVNRTNKHNLLFDKVKQELIQRELSSRMQIQEKMSRSDDICRKKAEALQRSRNLAARGAELRQALKLQLNPESFDQRVHRVNIEAKILK